MPYAEESLWENVLRQQHKEVNGLDGFTFMHSPIPVILVVESHLSVICNIDDPGVGYGGTEGISGDILYDLVNSLGWRATVHDPCFWNAFFRMSSGINLPSFFKAEESILTNLARNTLLRA